MNLPIARGLRGLIYVLSDLSQVDPSDLSTLFAGHGRLRIGFAEINPSPSHEPNDRQVEEAVRQCWQNPYYGFSKLPGTSLICIQGEWSNVVDARIKGGLAALASKGAPDNPYNPLYARAPHAPKPWGVTALFAEYTGTHAPLTIDWSLQRKASSLDGLDDDRNQPARTGDAALEIGSDTPAGVSVADIQGVNSTDGGDPPDATPAVNEEAKPSFASFWEFAVAINRGNGAALALAADGTTAQVPVDGREARKLLTTLWFRGVVPRLSAAWREQILEALVSSAPIPNHVLKINRHSVRLSEVSHSQLKDLVTNTLVPEAVRPDLDLLLTVARLWGEQALGRFQFAAGSENNDRFRLGSVLQGFRK